MTRKDLEKKYNFYGDNKDISLYRKKGEFTYGVGYCGNVALRNGKAVFNRKQYTTIEDLDKALVEWENSLPYPVDTYNPMMNERARIEQRLTWYLTEKMGFKYVTRNWDGVYERTIGPSASISFQIGKRTDGNDKASINGNFGPYHYSHEVDTAEEGIDFLSTVINSSVLQMAKDMVDVMSVCNDNVVTDIDAYVPANNIFGVEKVDFKSMMVGRLEKVLAGLKGEECGTKE